jgi:hypothetical protein
MHLRASRCHSAALIIELCLDVTLQQRHASSAPTELRGPILKPSWSEIFLRRAPPARNSSQGRGGSHSPLRVRPMEEGRKSSLSYRPAALPKPCVPSGCASIGIIAAPLSESLFVKCWS